MQNAKGSQDGNGLRLKTGLAEMLKGGVIMDVTNAEQAVIAEKSGAVAVMALERVPAQIRAEGGVARMAFPKKIREITVWRERLAQSRTDHFTVVAELQNSVVGFAHMILDDDPTRGAHCRGGTVHKVEVVIA